MKNILVLTGLLMVVLFSSCQNGNTNNAKKIDYSKIAGTWKSEKEDWQIVINKKGKIESAVIAMGRALVKPNETTTMKMMDGSTSSFTGGDFSLDYDSLKNEMEVNLIIKDIDVIFIDNEIKGHTEITIAGPIKEDSKVWEADVIERFDYGPRFPRDEKDLYPTAVKFLKVSK
jgi:hypothetical protein